jgi:spermidine synthase
VRDPFERKFVEISFYTMPVTTIPNDQTGFAESLFKKSESCKENTANRYRYEDLRFNQTNPAIDVHHEVFNANLFGNLT